MSPFLSSVSAITPSVEVTLPLSVEEQLVADWMAAREDDDRDRMRSLRMFARAISPALVAELDGFNYPAAA